MRLIDADALKEALTNTQTRLKYMDVFTIDDIKEFVDNAPTINSGHVYLNDIVRDSGEENE